MNSTSLPKLLVPVVAAIRPAEQRGTGNRRIHEMNPVLFTAIRCGFGLSLLGFLCAVTVSVWAAASPEDQRIKSEVRFQELVQRKGASDRAKLKLIYPARETGTQWVPAGTFLDHEIEHARAAGGNFVLRAIAPSRDGPRTQFAVIIRFLQRVPVNAFSGQERAYAEQHWKRVTEDGSAFYLEPCAQVDVGRFFKDEKTGKLVAKVVTWGANWRIHERAYEVEMVLLP